MIPIFCQHTRLIKKSLLAKKGKRWSKHGYNITFSLVNTWSFFFSCAPHVVSEKGNNMGINVLSNKGGTTLLGLQEMGMV